MESDAKWIGLLLDPSDLFQFGAPQTSLAKNEHKSESRESKTRLEFRTKATTVWDWACFWGCVSLSGSRVLF